MKRALLFIFMTVCVLGMSACSSKDAMPETSDSASNPVQNTDISNLNGGKSGLNKILCRCSLLCKKQIGNT